MADSYDGTEGDAALDAGYPVMDGTEKWFYGWKSINITRDLIVSAVETVKTWVTTLFVAKTDVVVSDGVTPIAGKIPRYTAANRMISGFPASDNDVANKAYVDGAVSGISLSSRVAKAGDTMTGDLTISGSGNHLYVPNSVAASSGYTNAYINGDGRLSRGASSERFKHDIHAIDPMELGELFPVLHTFVMNEDPGEMERVGYIAERLNESDDLRRFVVYARETLTEDIYGDVDVFEEVDIHDADGNVIGTTTERTGTRQEVVGSRIVGSQLARDENGEPIPESIDFIALLLAQVAQLHERVKTLEARDA